MSSHYKVFDNQLPHFVTSTVVGWIDALSREYYKEIICSSLKYCIANKGLRLHAWVVMPNHLHLIISCEEGNTIKGIMRDFKKYTSRQIVDAIANNGQESRREWMLNMFRFAASTNKATDEYQFWQHDYHPVALDDEYKTKQRLIYLHENPTRAGIVWLPEEYKYSSATDYYSSRRGLLPVVLLV